MKEQQTVKNYWPQQSFSSMQPRNEANKQQITFNDHHVYISTKEAEFPGGETPLHVTAQKTITLFRGAFLYILSAPHYRLTQRV